MTKHGMDTNRQSNTTKMISTQETTFPSHNGGSEGSVLPIVGLKLNRNNFPQWAQSIMMYVCGKGKDDYLTREIAVPEKEDPKFKTWKAENMMVMSRLINSMTTEVGEIFMIYATAKEMWDVTRKTYSDNENTSELIEIKGSFMIHDKMRCLLPNILIYSPDKVR